MKKRAFDMRNVFVAAAVGILILAVAAMLVSSFLDTNRRVEALSEEYIKNGTVQNAETLNGIFSGGEMSLDAIGKLYGEIEKKAENITSEDVKHLTEEVWFDRLIFADENGQGFDEENHKYEFSDNPNFKEAMKGKIGVSTAYAPSDRLVNRLCFYAPVKNGDHIFGALLGYFNDQTLEKMLQTKYFGYDSKVFLCDQSGVILATTLEDSSASLLDDYFDGTSTISNKARTELYQHMEKSETYGFTFATKEGTTKAYMVALDDSDLVQIQMFPEQAIAELKGSANADKMKISVTLIALFVIYLIVLTVLFRHRQQRMEEENRSISSMVGAITQMFDRFMLVDLENDSYEYIVDHAAVKLPGVEQSGAYHEIVDKIFRYCYRSDKEKQSMDQFLTIERLREMFQDGKDTLMVEYSEEFPGTEFRWTNLAVLCMERKEGVATKILLASQDETKIKLDEIRSKDALREAYQTAENASRAKSDFLSKMSHDIRTPMNAIIGMTALAGSYSDDKERVEDCLKKITVSSRHLLALINEVLDMSRIESSRLTLAEEEFDLADLLDTTLEMMQTSIKEKHLDLSVLIENIEHEKVIGDSLYVQKVFSNIMSNAVKYTPDGGKIRVRIAEKHATKARTGYYEFVFEDTGIGMTPEFLEKIYEPFERATDSRIDKIQGTGLGMSIVKNVVQMMGGDIKIESRVNEGTKVTVSILLKLQQNEEEVQDFLSDLQVLIADDEEIACVTICNMLEGLGMKSEWVLSGQEAVAKVVQHQEERDDFQAVILDWAMPGQDGIETARKIRAKVGDNVPVIIISAYDWSEIESEAKEAGVDAFISKPIFKSKLSATFKELFGDKEQEPTPIQKYQHEQYENIRALLVEDNEINREIATELLEMIGIQVDTAENGKVAVDKAVASEAGYYDIIFLDIQMPIMNGYEACEAIRAQHRKDLQEVPIIAITANAFPEDIMDAKHVGMNQHLAKPIDLAQLQAVLNRWLHKK